MAGSTRFGPLSEQNIITEDEKIGGLSITHGPTRIIALKKYLLDLRLVLFDTHEVSDEQVVRATDNLHLAAAILAMKHIFDELKEMKPVFQHAVKLDRDRFMMILEYITLTKEVNEQELEEILKESGVETMPSLVQKWLEQGRQQGIQQGL